MTATRTTLSRWIARIAIVVIGLGGAGLVQPGSAHATGFWSVISSNSGGAWLRFSPSTNAGAYLFLGNGTRVWMWCYTDTQWAQGNYWTNRWFSVYAPVGQTGQNGYVHASLVANQSPSPHC